MEKDFVVFILAFQRQYPVLMKLSVVSEYFEYRVVISW